MMQRSEGRPSRQQQCQCYSEVRVPPSVTAARQSSGQHHLLPGSVSDGPDHGTGPPSPVVEPV